MPGGEEASSRHHFLGDGHDLLANENAEQPDQRHQRRRRRAYIEKAIDDADKDAGAEREEIHFHGGYDLDTSVGWP
jgi:hypothetical protein